MPSGLPCSLCAKVGPYGTERPPQVPPSFVRRQQRRLQPGRKKQDPTGNKCSDQDPPPFRKKINRHGGCGVRSGRGGCLNRGRGVQRTQTHAAALPAPKAGALTTRPSHRANKISIPWFLESGSSVECTNHERLLSIECFIKRRCIISGCRRLSRLLFITLAPTSSNAPASPPNNRNAWTYGPSSLLLLIFFVFFLLTYPVQPHSVVHVVNRLIDCSYPRQS